MPASLRQITKDDILPLDEYVKVRKERRTAMSAVKRDRRVEVGPVATFYFENFETMLQQVLEMLFIEKGGDEQLADELAAYNPLIPQGHELVATVMFEIDDPIRREGMLKRLTHVEEHIYIQVDGEKVKADPEMDVERTTPDGKTSSVHFLHFRFTPEQIAKFKTPGAQIIVAIEHPNYGHMALLPEAKREALAQDFD